MKKDLAHSIVTALSVAVVLALSSTPSAGQVQPTGGGVAMTSLDPANAKSAGPAAGTADGKPDLSGLWGPDPHFMGDFSAALKPGEALPLQPWALKLTKERLPKDDPNANCLPAGVPPMAPHPWKIIQTPKLIVFLMEGNMHTYRQIFMDRPRPPKDVDPTWDRHSIRKWEGKTPGGGPRGLNQAIWF